MFHFASPAAPANPPNDRYTSFVSGHTSGAFALLFAAARVSRDHGQIRPKWIWLVGLPLGAATAYLRIAADRHYLTDVLAGAGIGMTSGWFVPALHESRAGGRPRVIPRATSRGAQVDAVWVW